MLLFGYLSRFLVFLPLVAQFKHLALPSITDEHCLTAVQSALKVLGYFESFCFAVAHKVA